MFSNDNTQGFNDAELNAMNTALESLLESGEFDRDDNNDLSNAMSLISDNAAYGDFSLDALTKRD